MTVVDSFKSKTVAVFLVMAALGSCASENENISTDSNLAQALTEEFLAGKTRLKCGIPCSGSWGTIKAKQRRIYDIKLWGELAEVTLQNGHEVDANYYYLGRSAEGLGYKKAAKVYYQQALIVHKCVGFLYNNCEGLDINSLAKQRLKNL
jgi:hypothetical protein